MQNVRIFKNKPYLSYHGYQKIIDAVASNAIRSSNVVV